MVTHNPKVVVEDETVWLTQKAMAALFDCSVSNVNRHLKAVFESGELHAGSVIKDFLITAAHGKSCQAKHYDLGAVISVGYQVRIVVLETAYSGL